MSYCIGWKLSQMAGKWPVGLWLYQHWLVRLDPDTWNMVGGQEVQVEGCPSHLKRLRVLKFNIIHVLWRNISEFSLFFHMNLHGDPILSSTTNSRWVNSFHCQIYPNSFSFSFSKYPVVLTFFILLARLGFVCLCSRGLESTRLSQFDSLDRNISKEDRGAPLWPKLPANSRTVGSAQAINHIFCKYTCSHHYYLRQEERGSSFPVFCDGVRLWQTAWVP